MKYLAAEQLEVIHNTLTDNMRSGYEFSIPCVGIKGISANCGFCAMVVPPTCLIAIKPNVPSPFTPDNTIPMVRDLYTWAEDLNETSILGLL